MNCIERIQYQAALAITGAWKGTNLDKIYEQLGWESLTDRRWFRRLTYFYKIHNNYTPSYLKSPIPPPRTHLYGDRSDNDLHEIFCKTNRYKNSFYPHSIEAWNDIGPELRQAVSLSVFKTNILKLIRPPKRDIFGVHDTKGIKRLFQLRVGLSPLKDHKKKHNFRDTFFDICNCLRESETTEHYLIRCITFSNERKLLMDSISPILTANNLILLDDFSKVRCLLYGHDSFSHNDNASILRATLKFMDDTERFM